jgi:cation:H+ antiporter
VIFDSFLVLVGLVILVLGGEALVRGASGAAIIARVTPAVIGLTIVAAGTSMPELVVSTQSALAGSPGLAIGNVVGSNIFNIGLIVGISALVRPLRVQGSAIRLEWPIMMLTAFQLYLLSRDGLLDRVEGMFLASALVAFVGYAVYIGRRDAALSEQHEAADVATASFGREGNAALLFNLGAIALGIALLAGGSTVLVRGAVGLASSLGVSETVIGLTIVAAGTSAPELFTSLIAARRGQDDIAIGNVIGSNIFNILGIAGITAVITPLEISTEILARDLWWMLGFSLLLFPLMKTGMKVVRWEGAVLLSLFIAYMAVLVRAVSA